MQTLSDQGLARRGKPRLTFRHPPFSVDRLRTRAQNARAFVVLMGLVAMLGDMTYEGARGLVGPYLGLLGASAFAVGFIAGFGELLGYALRLFTGWLADRTRAYWMFVILGYGTNLVVVLGLALADTWPTAALFLVLERVGKAIRSPAKSTLVSYAASDVGAGFTFGLEEALDQIGAVTGPLITALAIWLWRSEAISTQYKVAFLVLMLPVFANLALVFVARAKYPNPESFESKPVREHRVMASDFRWYLAAVGLLAFGFADWALVSFHAVKVGLFEPGLIPILYAAVMAADAIAALGFGVLFDRYGLSALAVSAFFSAAFAPFIFLEPSVWTFVLGAMFWAVGLGAQESIFKAAIAVLVPKEERARAYGAFFAYLGVSWWLGSTALGFLYERSLLAVVVLSSGTQLLAAPIFLLLGRKIRR